MVARSFNGKLRARSTRSLSAQVSFEEAMEMLLQEPTSAYTHLTELTRKKYIHIRMRERSGEKDSSLY